MKFPHTLEHKILNLRKKGSYLLFLPQDPSLFRIDSIVKDIVGLGMRMTKAALINKLSSRYKNNDIRKAIDELELIENRGFLNTGKMEAPFQRLIRKDRFQRLELHLSNDCNMACSYCAAKGGNYGLNLYRKMMDWSTARIAIDGFLKPNRDKKDALSIQFFGGEPLLNIEVLEKSLSYIQEKIDSGHYPFIQLTVATNGTLLTEEAIKILAKYNCIPWISLDASSNAHNKNRRYKDGRPSYNDVISGIKRLKNMAPDLPLILCPALGKRDDLDNILEKHDELKDSHIYLNMQFDVYDQEIVSRKEFDTLIGRIKGDMDRSFYSRIKEGKAFQFLPDYMFYHLHTGSDSYAGCGAGKNRIAVNADGEIFICSVAMGKGTRLGHVSDGLQPELQNKVDELSRGLHGRTLDCVNCWSRKLCNGPCILKKTKTSSVPGVNRGCDFMRLLNEFYLKSYASIERDHASRIFGINKNTKAMLEKINLLYDVRDLRNRASSHIKNITPVLRKPC